MDRARLAILAVCALLTTTIEPFGGAPQITNSPTPDAANVAFSSTNENISDAIETDIDTSTNADADEQIANQITRRLAMRHTGLSKRERIALVQTIIREARAQNLEPSLVVAVIEVESAGYHLAVSHVGAMGLMQILPSTGKELAAQMNIEWKGPDTLFDPIINVRLGTAYLRQLTDRFGSVHTALAAYNWGPGRIHRRLRRGATVPSGYIEQVMRAVGRNTTTVLSRS
jgi:soluble lytic murein transglycosylase-like protein